jgi:hypothetical protein
MNNDWSCRSYGALIICIGYYKHGAPTELGKAISCLGCCKHHVCMEFLKKTDL